MVAKNSSSPPGTNRPSIAAVARPGMTLCLYPAASIVGLAVLAIVAPTIRAMLPSRASVSSARSGSSSMPNASDTASRKARWASVILCGHSYAPIRATAADELGDGVVVVAERAVAGRAVGDQVEPGHPLLGGLDQVQPQVVADRQGEPADLADRLGASLEDLAVLVDQPVAPSPLPASSSAVKISRIGRRGAAPARARARTTLSTMASKSFMSTAPRPQTQPSTHLAGERRHRPVVGVGRHDVEVAVDQQRRSDAVDPLGLPVGDQRGAPGAGLEELARRCRPRRAARPPARRPPAPPARSRLPKLEVSIRIRSLAEVDDLGLGAVVRGHRPIMARPRLGHAFRWGGGARVAIVRWRSAREECARSGWRNR